MKTFKQFIAPSKIIVEVPAATLLTEATLATVGRYTARRDSPHFNGDEYHGHSEVAGGYEVAWNKSGSRRHESKFPATIPADARAAVAKVLGVSPNVLEGFEVFNDAGERVLLIEVNRPNDGPGKHYGVTREH